MIQNEVKNIHSTHIYWPVTTLNNSIHWGGKVPVKERGKNPCLLELTFKKAMKKGK